MSTRYPTDLPAVPPHRWQARIIDDGCDPDETSAWVRLTIDAADAGEAERRALAWIDYDYEDDCRGAVADAHETDTPGRWLVRVQLFARPR